MMQTKRLCKIIETSLQEQNLGKIKEYLSSKDSSEVFNATTLSTLTNIVKKSGKHEDKILHADCVLSCLEHFKKDINITQEKWKILADDVGKLCEVVFVISSTFIKDETLIEKNVTIFSDLVYERKVVADSMLRFTIEPLLIAASDEALSNAAKLCILRTISSILSKSSRELRKEIIPSKIPSLNKFSNILFMCGDYETQVATVEVLARCWYFIKDGGFENTQLFSGFPFIMDIFKTFKFINLDVECRLFLNILNTQMGDNQLVCSIPCMILIIDNVRYKKPSDPLYKEFWIDFNLKSSSMSFYYQNDPSELWEVMCIYEDDVICAEASNGICKGKTGGNIISVVKLEITFKKDSDVTKLLKIYFPKSKEYEVLEKRFVKEIFQDKFKSVVTYDEVNATQTLSQRKLAPVEQQAKSSGFKSQSLISPTMNSAELSLKKLNETDSEKPKMDTKSAVEKSNFGDYLNDSDSFSHYISKLKKEEGNANVEKEELDMDDVVNKTESKNQVNVEDSITGIEPLINVKEDPELGKEKLDLNDKSNKKTSNTNLAVTNMNPPQKPLGLTTNIYISKGNAAKSDCLDTNKTKKTKSLTDLHDNSNPVKRRRLFSSETNCIKDLILSSQEDFSAEIPKYKLQKKEEYKFERQKNVDRKNITFSYINDREINKQTRPVKNNTFSYINDREINKQTRPVKNKIFSDISDDEEDEVKCEDALNKRHQKENIHNTTPILKCPISEKKLLELNNTPEGVEESKIFSPKSPNFLVSKKETHLKKTYARSKPKRGRKRSSMMHILSSDSDSDYIPGGKLFPVVPSRQKEKRATKRPLLNLEGFSDKLPSRIDPIRNIEHVGDEIEIHSANLVELEEPRKIEVSSALQQLTPDSDTPQKNKIRKTNTARSTKQNTKKKSGNEVVKKKTAQTRKPRVNKTTASKKAVENNLKEEVSTSTNVVNYQHPVVKEEYDADNLALDIPRPTISQDSDLSDLSPGTLLMFGRQCLTETNNRIKNMLILGEKEREMHYSSYSFKAHECFTSLQESKQKQMAISNNLIKAKSLLENTAALQNELFTEIAEKSKQLEDSRLLLMDNLSKVEQAQSSRITSIFQDLGKYMSNFAVSFFQRNFAKQSLEN